LRVLQTEDDPMELSFAAAIYAHATTGPSVKKIKMGISVAQLRAPVCEF
jgi:hypothetical protein